MASWTDKTPPTFSPYISQLPVQAMVSVGEQKQQQYNEGVQKIQSQIDNVAGMDVMRDVDKQYLQSKLNTLGNNLRTVAAGDFSNFQLVNSVAGMTNQIVKDPTVQNAVLSTQRIRKGITDKESANKNGKGSVENDWYFDKGVNDYINNNDLKASYSGNYIEYNDLKPKMLEVLKSLHESGNDSEVPWQTDPATGEILYGKTAAAMVEHGWKGITSGKIENALRASFNENDLRQMQISGEYQFKDYTPTDLINHATQQYEQNVSLVKTKIADLQKQAELKKGNPNFYNEAQSTIKELQDGIGEGGSIQNTLKQQLQNSIAQIRSNPNAVKGELYKDAMVKQFSNAHSWEENTLKYNLNPYLESEHWEKNYGIQRANLDLAQRKYLLDVHASELNDKKFDLTEKEFEMKYGDADKWTTTLGTTYTEKDPQARISNDITSNINSANDETKTLADLLTTRLQAKDPTVVVSPADVTAMAEGTYDGPLKKLIPPELKDRIDGIIDLKLKAGASQTILDYAKATVANLPEIKDKKKDIDKELANHNNVTGNVEGVPISFSPTEIINYLKKFNELNPITSQAGYQLSNEPDTSVFSDREKLLYKSGLSKTLVDEYRPFFNKNLDYFDTYNKALDNELIKRNPQYVSKLVSVGSTPEIKARYATLTSGLLDRLSTESGKQQGTDPTKISSWLTGKDKNDLNYYIEHDGDTKQLVITHGGESQKITLTPIEVTQIPEAQTSPTKEIENRFIQFDNTTNCLKGENPRGAFWKNLPGIKSSQVVGDAVTDRNHAKVYPRIQVNTSEGWKTLVFDNSIPIGNVSEFFANLTDEQVVNELKKQIPSFNGTINTK